MKATHKNISYISTNVRKIYVKQILIKFAFNAMGLLFPRKTRMFIKRRFFRPVRKIATANEQQWLDCGRKFQIQVHGKTIQCWKWGSGPPILAVHGWNGRGVNLHPLFAPLLQQGFAVVAFDAPAHGVSEGDYTNYFEFTDTVRAMVDAMGEKNVVGIVAHSLGGAAVINCLSKEGMSPKTVLIAPALRLKELLFNTFKTHGVPSYLYHSIIKEIEKEYGYSIERDNPFLLLKQMDNRVMIAHDQADALIPFADAKVLADGYSHILLYATQGLGHKSILNDPCTVDRVIQYLTQPVAGIDRKRIPA
jgi:hypothetical protein